MGNTNPARLDPATVRDWLDQSTAVTVIDVRSPAEFSTVHIRGSINVPLSLVSEHAEDIAPRLDGQVVLVCQSGARAAQAQQRLGGVGAERLHVLDGGLPAYIAAGGYVVRGRARWALERQVRPAAGTLGPGRCHRRAPCAPGTAARRRCRHRADPVRPHRHLHHGPGPVRAALQPRPPRPQPGRGPRPAPDDPGDVNPDRAHVEPS